MFLLLKHQRVHVQMKWLKLQKIGEELGYQIDGDSSILNAVIGEAGVHNRD